MLYKWLEAASQRKAKQTRTAIMLCIEQVSTTEPATCLHALSDLPHLAFLDSAQRSPSLGRYSFLAIDPFAIFRVEQGKAFWNGEALKSPPFVALQEKLSQFQMAKPEGPSRYPPFCGGAVGYFSYEAGRLLECLPTTQADDLRLADIVLPFYDLVLAVDHFPEADELGDQPQAAKAWIFSSGLPKSGPEQQQHAENRLNWFKQHLLAAEREPSAEPAPPAISGWNSNFSRPAFEKTIAATREHILDGDIFQTNITQRFSATLPDNADTSPLAYYQQLRVKNAAPFAAYLDCGDHIIASSSPERFIILDEDGKAETRPIKGTAPRDLNNPDHDSELAQALVESEKDQAENVMITDLMRNDLSRVSKPGSVKVPSLCGLESYARVHHLVSTVTAQLKDGLGAVALLGACFPGGSITGAPKIRAMEIISELEQTPRNIYCGSIGYIGFDGVMDTNIAIRTLLFTGNEVHFNVGGGITILSRPEDEYEECLHKADAILRAVGTSLQSERSSLAQGPGALGAGR